MGSIGGVMSIGNEEIQDVSLLRIEETASILRVSQWTIRNWCKSGKISYHRIGGKRILMIDRSEVIRIINESRVSAA
jgi:excisionase family DNA binding protein